MGPDFNNDGRVDGYDMEYLADRVSEAVARDAARPSSSVALYPWACSSRDQLS